MPPRTQLATAPRALALRSKPCQAQRRAAALPRDVARTYASASKEMPESPDGKGPNTEQLPHVSEEAAATKEAMGEQGPDVSQGTPVQEVRSPFDAQFDEYAHAYEHQVIKGDKDAEKKLPKVMRDELKAGKRSFSTFSATATTRSFSTSAARRDLTTYQGGAVIPPSAIYSSPAYAAFLK
ncbi:MAG: hypothetical protein INR71_01325, partial [Terriglobus roseus]|nr:hypothetical protein [Terriglobus roseus]